MKLVNNEKLYIVFLVIVIIFNTCILRFMAKPQFALCECTKNIRRELIRYYLIFSLISSSLIVLCYIFNLGNTFKKNYTISSSVLIPLTICNFIVTYQYQKLLKDRDCACIGNNSIFELIVTLMTWLMSINGIFIILGIIGWVFLKQNN